MASSQKCRISLLVTALFFISTSAPLMADFRYGVYCFLKGGGGFDFSEDKEIYPGDPNCDMDWGQFEIPYIYAPLVDLGEGDHFFGVAEAPLEDYSDPNRDYKEKQIYMEHNHVYILKTKENCYVKILIISEYPHAMLWVYQDDGSRNLDWRGTTTNVDREFKNISSNPNEFIFIQNYPNPFNSGTMVELALPPNGFHHAKLNAFNSAGQLVAELFDDKIFGSTFRIRWDGRLNFGVAAPSGVYLINAIIDNKYTRSKRVLLAK